LPLTLDESLTVSIYKYGKRQAEKIIVVLNFIHKLPNIILAVLTKYVECIIGGHYCGCRRKQYRVVILPP
jgi:hypothetical protein